MDIKEYISSGVLERYVLGAVSSEEQQEVEHMAQIYPEISTELRDLEQSIENFTKAMSVEPPKALKQRILDEIDNISQESNLEKGIYSNSSTLKVVKKENTGNSAKEAKVVNFLNRTNLWKLAAAACFLIIFGTGYLMYRTDKTSVSVQQQVAGVSDGSSGLETENQNLQKQLADLNQLKSENDKISYLLAHQATKKIELSGTKNSPESQVRVYWNTETASVLLKVDALPDVPEGKQYQLWAIADDTPLNMGVIDIDAKKDLIKIMPIVCKATAQSFAITLEEEGGVDSPTLSAMYALGNV